jgi:hypothetical protein
MREGWNFHSDVAMVLEEYARDHYISNNSRTFNKIYDADAIQYGHFVEVMIMLLRDITNKSNEYERIDSFVKRIIRQEYLKPESVDKNEIFEVFEDFKILYEEYNNVQ